MVNPEEFMLDDTPEAKAIKALKHTVDASKKTAFGFFAKAHGFWRRAAAGDPSPTLIGRASAYLTAFMEIAPVLGIKPEIYMKTVKELSVKIGALLQMSVENANKTVIEHRRDPKGLEIEAMQAALKKRELDIREIKVVERKETAAPSGVAVSQAVPDAQARIDEVSMWLSNTALGFDKADAARRAKAVYRPDASIEELVAEACRVS